MKSIQAGRFHRCPLLLIIVKLECSYLIGQEIENILKERKEGTENQIAFTVCYLFFFQLFMTVHAKIMHVLHVYYHSILSLILSFLYRALSEYAK